jgi:hypothetical protein
MYRIVEDCSPYYVRFTASEHSKVVDICQQIVDHYKDQTDFTSIPVESTDAKLLVEQIPLFGLLRLNKQRINLFVSQPGVYRPPHKDGAIMQFGINFMIEVLDDKCITSWYGEELAERKDYFSGIDDNGIQHRQLRELREYQQGEATPIKSMIAMAADCVLFNVGMFHDWDNTASPNRRIVLTLRPPPGSTMSFEQAKKILFQNKL